MPDITVIRGDSRIVGTPVFDADKDRFRTDTELDSVNSIEYQVSDAPEASTVHISKTDADSEVFVTNPSGIDSVEFDGLDSDTGILRVKLTPTDTEDIPAETLWHEFQIIDANGNTVTVMRGDFDVLESATNP
jgi:hypothetical protein